MGLVIAMSELELPDAHCLLAAIGWLELGNPKEAKAELCPITLAGQRHPDVLEVRWRISVSAQDWEEALCAGRALVKAAPESCSGWVYQAYALRRTARGGLRQAWQALLPAYRRFPREPVIPFNLACYACQLHRLRAARAWLKRAIDIQGESTTKSMALKEPDLEPLWDEIGNL